MTFVNSYHKVFIDNANLSELDIKELKEAYKAYLSLKNKYGVSTLAYDIENTACLLAYEIDKRSELRRVI